MRSFLIFSLIFILSASCWGQEEQTRLKALEAYRPYGSRLANAQQSMLRHKLQMEPQPWYSLSGYGLGSDVYGGLRHQAGGLDTFTGQKAAEDSLALRSRREVEIVEGQRSVPLSQVTSVTVRSHPWEEMNKAKPDGPPLPSLLKMVPRDLFVLSFQNGADIGHLEDCARALAEGARDLVNFDLSLSATDRVAERLGVKDFRKLEPLMGETVFVSEDLDFYPGTHYALLFKTDSLTEIGANLLLKSKVQGRVGDAFVLSTSQALFDRIVATSQNKEPNLATAPDLVYCNKILDPARDGFAYLSEEFITRMVSPAYRINSERRLGAINRMVDLQYDVLSYRTLTGQWPADFQEIVTQGYRAKDGDYRGYSIDSAGHVRHQDWGSLWDLRPLSEVPIEEVTPGERDRYERFRESYDQLWTRFFDPVGVAFEVKQSLRAHTVVLPLINTREYNLLQLVSGGQPIEFQSLTPALNFPASLHFRFNAEDALLGLVGGTQDLDDARKREELKNKVNREFRSVFSLDDSHDLFTLFGREIGVLMGPEFTSSLSESTDLVAFVALQEPERFDRVVKALMGGDKVETRESEGLSYQVHSRKGTDLRLFLLIHERVAYLTLREDSLKRLSSALKKPANKKPLDAAWVGGAQNVLFRADFSSFAGASAAGFLDQGLGGSGPGRFKEAIGYKIDEMLLEKALGKEGSSGFFRYPPNEIHGVALKQEGGRITAGGLNLEQIDFEDLPDQVPAEKGRTSYTELVNQSLTPEKLAQLRLFQEATVGLQLSEEGLSSRLAINNPVYSRQKTVSKSLISPLAGAAVVGGLVVAGAAFARKREDLTTPESAP